MARQHRRVVPNDTIRPGFRILTPGWGEVTKVVTVEQDGDDMILGYDTINPAGITERRHTRRRANGRSTVVLATSPQLAPPVPSDERLLLGRIRAAADAGDLHQIRALLANHDQRHGGAS